MSLLRAELAHVAARALPRCGGADRSVALAAQGREVVRALEMLVGLRKQECRLALTSVMRVLRSGSGAPCSCRSKRQNWWWRAGSGIAFARRQLFSLGRAVYGVPVNV
jgi:hypothetical protein